MANDEILDGEKPEAILRLEQIYGITLKESEGMIVFSEIEEDIFYRPLETRSYTVDEFGNVTGIDLAESAITDLSALQNLTTLKHLGVTGNNISNIEPLRKLRELRLLYLGGNTIHDISPVMELPNLLELAIWGNPVDDITLVSNLVQMEALYISNTNTSNISFISNLKNLKRLGAQHNKITDISVFALLHELDEVDLGYNRIEDLADLVDSINIRQLSLQANLLKQIPKKIAEKYRFLDYTPTGSSGYRLLLSDNPLAFPPYSVITLGPDTVKNYYETAETFGHAPLSEGRIIVVGDGSAGKSSLVEKLLYDRFDENKGQTNGVFIDNWLLTHEDGRPLTFHIWDFGGQEIQHAVHKFFFTEGCLYVLVLDNRKEEDPEYWLQQIESLGGKAPVLVVFNKQDQSNSEIADRKFLKEKYPNIVGFYTTSCKTGFGIAELKQDLEKQAVQLRTVEERFPNNWFAIKKAIEERTSGAQHYLTFETYRELCRQNHVDNGETQKLLLRYFTTIGAVTWFGDTYLNFLHVLSPAWITQGVYKIVTAQKTAKLFGQIHISDFKELLHPLSDGDYTYSENHYGYILSMMKKFDLCYTPDDQQLLIPSAFGKMPKVEYSDYRGENVRTYILQFKDYMPMALIHRYVAKRLGDAYQNNFWYSGIVIKDAKSDVLSMVQADKEAKRIYVRVKGDTPLGIWEHIRREMAEIISSYANIQYSELVALDERAENTVDYQDLVAYLQANKPVYFHPRLKKDFNVGYLIGLFEHRQGTLRRIMTGQSHNLVEEDKMSWNDVPSHITHILNNNTPNITVQVNTQINIDIDIQLVNDIGSTVKGDAGYLLEALGESNKALSEALQKVIQFAEDAKKAQNSGDVKEKGWGRKLKGILELLGKSGEQFKNIQDGGEVLKSIFSGIKQLAGHFHFNDLLTTIANITGIS